MKIEIQKLDVLKAGVVKFLREEDGATAIEYGLLAGLIAAIIIVAVSNLGKGVNGVFTSICSSLQANGLTCGAATTGGGTGT